jgi:hypothetical protein
VEWFPPERQSTDYDKFIKEVILKDTYVAEVVQKKRKSLEERKCDDLWIFDDWVIYVWRLWLTMKCKYIPRLAKRKDEKSLEAPKPATSLLQVDQYYSPRKAGSSTLVDPSGRVSNTLSANTDVFYPTHVSSLISSPIQSPSLPQTTEPQLYHPQAQNILEQWDGKKQCPTWKPGRQILQKWFSNEYPALAENRSAKIDIKAPILTRKPEWTDVIADIQAVKQKPRIWNSITNKMEGSATTTNFLARHFNESPIDPPLTALGVKATEKGLARCGPRLPDYFYNERRLAAVPEIKVTAAVPAKAGKNQRKSRRIKTSTNQVTSAPSEIEDWEVVMSESHSITGFHFDSAVSGSFHLELFGTKIIGSCPCTEKNWEIFKEYYINMASHDEYQICIRC